MGNNTNVPVIDVALLRKTLEHIEAHENEWTQWTWRTPRRESSCGTAMCFGGWAAHLMGCEWTHAQIGEWVLANEADREWVEARDEQTDFLGEPMIQTHENREVIHVAFRAQRLLGLTDEQRTELFSGSNSLEDLQRIVAELAQEALQ